MLRDRSEDYRGRDTWQEGNPNWHGVKAKSGGGLFLDNFSHYLDYFRFLTGLEVDWVFAKADTFLVPADVEDTLIAVCAYTGGASGSFVAGSAVRGAGKGKDPRVANSRQRIWGEFGQVVLEPEPALFSTRRIGGRTPGKWHRGTRERRGSTGAGLAERREFIDDWARAVREGRKPEIDGEDGRKVMAVVEAVYRSARTGEKVELASRNGEGRKR